MNKQIQTYLDSMAKATDALRAFGEKYDLPEGIAWPDACPINGASIHIHLRHRSDSEKARALQVAGDVLGRDGWTATINYNRDAFDWQKTFDGVAVKISDAETMPPAPPEMPVPPSKFPIQLEDAK